jgi:hypothetical protein
MIFLGGTSLIKMQKFGMMAVVFIANASIAAKKLCRILKGTGLLLIKETLL